MNEHRKQRKCGIYKYIYEEPENNSLYIGETEEYVFTFKGSKK